jgi:hypothetical protein
VHLGPFTIAKTLVRASVPSLALAPWAAGQNAEINLLLPCTRSQGKCSTLSMANMIIHWHCKIVNTALMARLTSKMNKTDKRYTKPTPSTSYLPEELQIKLGLKFNDKLCGSIIYYFVLF